MQLDYRDYFCDSTIERNYKSDLILLNKISSSIAFYDLNKPTQRYNYIVANCEVRNWINKNGIDKFYLFIDLLGKGRKFTDIY